MSLINTLLQDYRLNREITGFLLEKIFHNKWWDYSDQILNLNGRICLINCLGFGILGFILIKYLNNFLYNIYSNLNETTLNIIFYTLITIFIIDLIVSFKVIFKVKNMTIHKAGYILLLKILIVLIILNLASFYFINNTSIVYTILGITVVMYLLVVNFFRFPNRVIIQDDNTILAPADGKIVVIEETEEPEYFKDRRLQVSIFMNIFNVHINWFPVNGVIKYFKYHKGNFAAAYLPKSSTDNERTTIVIECNNGKTVLMRQIAGAMAKRIVSYAPVGGQARQDQHAGFIKFGSRVDLFLPLGTQIEVKLGQKTTGSQTIIGTFK